MRLFKPNFVSVANVKPLLRNTFIILRSTEKLLQLYHGRYSSFTLICHSSNVFLIFRKKRRTWFQ
jgi:hypothetical protein